MRLLPLILSVGLLIGTAFLRPASNFASAPTSVDKDIMARGENSGYPFYPSSTTQSASVSLNSPTAWEKTPTDTVSRPVVPNTEESNGIPTAWGTTVAETVVPETLTASVTQNTESQGTSTIREITVTETVVTESTVTASVSCDRVKKFQKPKPKDWVEHDMDKKFKAWIKKYMGGKKKLDATWGEWAFGDPNWSCSDDGSEGCTNYDCDNAILNAKNDDDLRLALYVTQAMINLHSWITGAGEALTQASIFAALSKDKWVLDFFKEDGDGAKNLKEILSTAGIIIGVALAFISAQPELGVLVGGMIGSTSLLANTVPGLLLPHIKKEQEDGSFKSGANIGEALGRLALETQRLLTVANNDIMDGNGTNTNNLGSTVSDYFREGKILNYKGIDKVEVEGRLTGVLQSKAIDSRWKEQSVFIMGGGPCVGDEGIGIGPEEGSLCIDDQIWYLYGYEKNTDAGGKKSGVALRAPPGMDKLGKGDFAFVTKEDVIRSSVAANKVASLDYTESVAKDQIMNALETGKGNPFEPSWEGTFTIPVCDVGILIYHDYPKDDKSRILVPYGKEPRWCGPICEHDNVVTQTFYEAAHLKGLEHGPFDGCSKGVDYSNLLAINVTVAANMELSMNMTLS